VEIAKKVVDNNLFKLLYSGRETAIIPAKKMFEFQEKKRKR